MRITEKEVTEKLAQLKEIIKQYKEENSYEDKRDWRTYEERLALRIKTAVRSLGPLIDEAIAALNIIHEETRGKPSSLTLKQKVTLLMIKQLIGKSNREMAGMLSIFSLLTDVDVSYKTVERLYCDEEVYMVLSNMVQLILKKKDVKEVDGSGDGTGYSLSISRHYATEASKRNQEIKELGGENDKKAFVLSFTLLDLDTKMYVGYGSSMKSERDAYNKAREMMKRFGINMRTIRLDRYYSGQSTLEQFKGTTLYFIPKKNSTLRGDYEWKKRLFEFVNNTFDYLSEYFCRENSEAEISADKRRFGWTVRQKIETRIDTALLGLVAWHNMYHLG